MTESMISDEDARLIHALQLSPRAPWSELARVLKERPATLARRYARLHKAGVVRIFGRPTGNDANYRSAIVEIDLQPGSLTNITAILVEMPIVLTLDVTTSGTCVIATLGAPTGSALTKLLLEQLPSMPGVRDVRAYMTTAVLKTGERWNLRALTAEEAARITGPLPPRPRAARRLDPQFRSGLMIELGEDGRKPVAALARELGVSEQRTHDAIALLLHTNQFRLRADVTNVRSEWPVHIWYFVDIPPRQLSTVASALIGYPEVRYVGTAAGPANLTFDVWLRHLGVLHLLEERITALSKIGITIRRQVILRTPKRLGHLLDTDGLFTDRYIASLSAEAL